MTTAIAGINNLAGGTPPSTLTPTGSSALGQDQFMQLLLAQLANQDPTQPVDNQQFIAQLAQFSSLQDQEATNTKLDSLLSAAMTSNQTASAGFIGKEITYNQSQVVIGASGGADVKAQLAQASPSVTAVVKDANGAVVRTLPATAEPSGAITLHWDGTTDAGTAAPAGTYSVTVSAADASGNSITVTQQGQSLCTGIDYSAGYAQLIVDGTLLKMNSVISVAQAPTTTP
jgi:flagellar basal-body rod modification protein FlgD